MNNRGPILTAQNGFYAILLFTAAALLALAPHAAVNVDEQLHYPHAKKVVNWYFTGGEDESCLNTPETNLRYYGQSVDNFTALINRIFSIEDEFRMRHFTGAFFFWLLLLFTGMVARRISGSWQAATIAVLALLFMPRLTGQAFGNLKDIPFAAGYMAGVLMIVHFLKELPVPRWKTAVLLGVAIAFTVSVRAGGFILFAYLGLGLLLFFVLKPFYLKQIATTKPVFVRLLGQGTAILIIGYFAGLLFWPYALQDIWEHPLESLRVMEHYKVSIHQVFQGQWLWSTQLPWYYLPVWFVISTPLYALAGFLVFLVFFFLEIYRKSEFDEALFYKGFLLFVFAFPFIYVMAIGANLYSGVRQMLFIFPPMAVLSAWGMNRLISGVSLVNRKKAWAVVSLFFLLVLPPLRHQVMAFPVDYVYFNALVGGNKGAWSDYEYDYYFHGVKEACEYAVELAGDNDVTIALNCNLSNYFEQYPTIRCQYTRFLERSSYDWDYAVLGVNYIHPFLLKNELWKPEGTIKTFYQRGNPVAVLVKRTNKNDFHGIAEIKSGNLKEGKALLEKAVEKQPRNVWLYVHLARAELNEGNVAAFEYYVGKGKEIHPWFEPFFLLEATRYYEEGRIEQSLQQLEALFDINPRYLPAKELYEEVKQK